MRSFGRDGDPASDARSEIRTIDRNLSEVCPASRGKLRTRRRSHTAIQYSAIRYYAIRYSAIHYELSAVDHMLQEVNDVESRPSEQIGIVIGFGFGWLTLNNIEFATKDTRRLLPGRIFGLPLNRESPTSVRTSPLDCLSRQNVNSHHPSQLR